jgi:hypothetical protein
VVLLVLTLNEAPTSTKVSINDEDSQRTTTNEHQIFASKKAAAKIVRPWPCRRHRRRGSRAPEIRSQISKKSTRETTDTEQHPGRAGVDPSILTRAPRKVAKKRGSMGKRTYHAAQQLLLLRVAARLGHLSTNNNQQNVVSRLRRRESGERWQRFGSRRQRSRQACRSSLASSHRSDDEDQVRKLIE